MLAEVLDGGPGVTGAERERIFDGFVRLDHGHPGGAGLSIARRIARQHGGELTCVTWSSGACFVLRVPAEPAWQPNTSLDGGPAPAVEDPAGAEVVAVRQDIE